MKKRANASNRARLEKKTDETEEVSSSVPSNQPSSVEWDALLEFRNFKGVHEFLDRIGHQDLMPVDRHIHEAMCVGLIAFCPLYDFERDSVQKRILSCMPNYFTVRFHEQETMRLKRGAELALQFVFGEDYHKYKKKLPNRFLLHQVEWLRSAPELLQGNASILDEALMEGDSCFFHQLAGKFERPAAPVRQCGDKSLPELAYKRETVRNWTNPDFPLWLMKDPALKQAIRLLTAGVFANAGSLRQTLLRLKLKRNLRKPIRSIVLTKQTKPDRLRFDGFVFAAYVSNMDGVPPPAAYGETGKWSAGRIS